MKNKQQRMTVQFVLNNLSGGYGEIQVINNFSLTLNEREIAFIAGRNGVGKSTLIKMITGHFPLMSGTIHFSLTYCIDQVSF